MKRKSLFFVLLLGLVLRLLWLDKYPSGFTPDEASFGYDAYSILKTGKDQWGHSFPLVLESFGDFKAPLYSYILIPFVWLFGLSKTVVRLPNALLGTATIYVTYLLVKELKTTRKEKLETLAAALLAISPWHVMMSRGAFEANLTTFFLPLGIYLFLRGLKKDRYLFWSSVVFGLNMFTYHSAKVVTPPVVLLLIFLYWTRLKKIHKKTLYKFGGVFLIFALLTLYTFSIGAGARVKDVSIFSGALEEQAENRLSLIENGMSPQVARVFSNKYIVITKRFVNNYKQYVSSKFLFFDGPAEATYGMIPGRGVVYLFELPFLFGFLLALIKRKINTSLLLISGWIILAPIPAALAVGKGYAANRAVVVLPALTIALVFGVFELIEFFNEKLSKKRVKFLLTIYAIVSALFFVSFVQDYFVFSPGKTSKAMLYGNLEAARWLLDNTKGKVVVSRKLSEPHIYIAFANKWDPKDYQKQVKNWKYQQKGLSWVDQLASYNLGRYIFENIDWKIHGKTDLLLVGRSDEFPKDTVPFVAFYYPTGEESILVVNQGSQIYAKKNN